MSIDRNNQLGGNYYLIDNVEVVKLTKFEKQLYLNECSNCVDLDPMTSIPSEREITIDKGFIGKMTLELGVRLKPREKYVLEYGKNHQIIIVNTGTNHEYSFMEYVLEYPAKKLRKSPVRFYVEKSKKQEIKSLLSTEKNITQIKDSNFKGILIKRIKK